MTDSAFTTRPFLLTRGRTVRRDDLPLETQVVAVDPTRVQPFEQGEILRLAAEPLSVAEVAAHLQLHLGVVRVLVSQLHADGLLAVHGAGAAATDADTLRRVVHGLRSLA